MSRHTDTIRAYLADLEAHNRPAMPVRWSSAHAMRSDANRDAGTIMRQAMARRLQAETEKENVK